MAYLGCFATISSNPNGLVSVHAAADQTGTTAGTLSLRYADRHTIYVFESLVLSHGIYFFSHN